MSARKVNTAEKLDNLVVAEKQRSGKKSSAKKAVKRFFSSLLAFILPQKLHDSEGSNVTSLPELPVPSEAAANSNVPEVNNTGSSREINTLTEVQSLSQHDNTGQMFTVSKQPASLDNCCLYQEEKSYENSENTRAEREGEVSAPSTSIDILELVAQSTIDLERLEINARGTDKTDKKKARTEPYPKINNNRLQNGGRCIVNHVPELELDVEDYMIPLPVCNLTQNSSNLVDYPLTLHDTSHPNFDALLNADISFSSPDDAAYVQDINEACFPASDVNIITTDLFAHNLLSVEPSNVLTQVDDGIMCPTASNLTLLSADFVGDFLKEIEEKTCYNITPSVSTDYSCSSMASPDVDSGYHTGSPSSSSSLDTDYTYRTLGNMYISDEDEYLPSVIPSNTAIQAVQEISDKKPKVKRRLWTTYSLETADFFLTPDENGLNLIQSIVKNESTDILIKIFAAITNLMKCASPQIVKEAFEREPRVLTLAQRRRIPLLREYLKEVIDENERKLIV